MGTSLGKTASSWLVAVLAAAGCDGSPPEGGAGRGVLLVAIDGLRADHVHVQGGLRPATPTLDGLTEEG